MIRFGKTVAADYARSSRLEWLQTNGLGGYASSTVAGANTRRYHGLLIAALNPPGARTMTLQKLEERIGVRDDEYRLSTNAYPGTLYPNGYEYLEEFRLDPFPIFKFRVAGVTLEKEICLVRGENTVIVQYSVPETVAPVRLAIDLLVNYRSHYTLTRENGSLRFHVEPTGDAVRVVASGDSVPFYVFSDKAKYEEAGYWYRNFIYNEERERGYDYQEDVYNPGHFTVQLEEGDSVRVAASIHAPPSKELDEIVSEQRKKARTPVGGADDEFLSDLTIASDAFLVRRGDGTSCIAGYHWFADWGRDAMISLPGLCLVTGRYDVARLLLRTFARYAQFGLIPNCFSDTDGSPQYNSLDATLWFFHAMRKYFQYTKDTVSVKELYPVLKGSVDALLSGTIYDIKADTDLLLNIGRTDVQLTWMDAKIGDYVVTPRNGKPVEINALWHNALDTVSSFAALLGNDDDQARFADLAEEVKRAFAKSFWNAYGNCLFDRIVHGKADASMRPNQTIALALPKPILGRAQERAAVAAVQEELLTPYGLRTLSPKDPNYKGRYQGDQRNRDLAYHQGPAWPWLLGPFIKAFVRVSEAPVEARRVANGFLENVRTNMREAGLGYISELFDGDLPQQPRGCIAQAWSVAEILRAYYEDILGKEPEDTLLR
jgi:predicted glycogen debranching enzyme